MSIRLQCDNCQKRYLLSDKFAASQVDCRNCGQTISVKPRVKESVEKHESQSRLACPACTDSSLTERTLKNGVTVDSCKSCRGTWLDAGEFLQLTRNKEDATQNVLALSWGAVKSKRHCPHCQTSMSEAAFLDDETRIDFCQHCDGLWFDDGELKDSLQGLRMGLPFYSITELADSQMTKASTNLDSERKYSDELALRRLLAAFSKRYWAFRDVLLFAAIGFSCLMLISLYQTTWRMSQLDWILVEAVAGRGYIKTYESSSGGTSYTSSTLHMTYSYEVHGKQYSGSYTSGGVREAPSQGSMMEVYYNPDDPSDTTRMRRRGIVESWALVIVTGGMAIVGGLLVFLCPSHDSVKNDSGNGKRTPRPGGGGVQERAALLCPSPLSEIRCPRCNAVQFRDHGDCHACGSSMTPDDANTTSSEIPNRIWLSYLAIHVLRVAGWTTLAIFFCGMVIAAVISTLVGSNVGFGAGFLVCGLGTSILWTIVVSIDFSCKVVAIQDKQERYRHTGTDAGGGYLSYELDTDHGTASVSKALYRSVEIGFSYRCWVVDWAWLPFWAKELFIGGPFERVKA